MSILYPVILCGGSGVRLWPLSRSTYPKQFMDVDGQSLFDDTVRRAAKAPVGIESGRIIVVCNEEQRFLAAAALQANKIKADIILEPVARNTAPAIALAAFDVCDENPEGLMLVLPSDHKVEPQEQFEEAVGIAAQCAGGNYLVTFGVVPSGPETGYGYIKAGNPLPLQSGLKVERFVEKPDLGTARSMLKEGGYFWNSGMFLFKAKVYLDELGKHSPEIFKQAKLAWENRRKDDDFIRVSRNEFLNSPADSIDYAVMEHTDFAAVVPLSAVWNDLGSWDAFYDVGSKDAHGNVIFGDVISSDVSDSYLHASNRMLAALGVSGLAIVETPDAVLVAARERSQDVKKIVDELHKKKRVEKDIHRKVFKPWGSYEVLSEGEKYQVKRINVGAGKQISLQMHKHRSEHWVVVSGTARVSNDKGVLIVNKDESVYIPVGSVHRLENPGPGELVVIEIQNGDYLGEDDIVRIEDDYGRVKICNNM